MNVFDRKQTTETVALSFDIVNELADNETINSVSCTMAVRTGTDASPSSMLQGAATFLGTKGTQLVTGGIDGVYYLLTMTFVTSFQTLTYSGVVPVINGE